MYNWISHSSYSNILARIIWERDENTAIECQTGVGPSTYWSINFPKCSTWWRPFVFVLKFLFCFFSFVSTPRNLTFISHCCCVDTLLCREVISGLMSDSWPDLHLIFSTELRLLKVSWGSFLGEQTECVRCLKLWFWSCSACGYLCWGGRGEEHCIWGKSDF